jgi:phosphate starvation-inducible protein PhoH
MATKRLNARQKRQQKSELNTILNKKMSMKKISPLTRNQSRFMDSYRNGYHVANIGSAGSGKTYLALALGLEDVLDNDDFDSVIIIRSAVQSRDQGFMPGSLTEKMAYYEAPYIDIVTDLFDRKDAYNVLKSSGQVKFMSTSFVRGLTFDRAVIIVDEVQNMTYEELRTIITRVGEGSRIIICGDTKQDDLMNSRNRLDRSGLGRMLDVLSRMDSFATIEFTREDIVRSGFVKEFIITEETMFEAA